MRLEAQNVSFRYPHHARWIVKDVSFTINTGDCLALTGPSGCGKTTLAKLLAGYLQPTRGRILLDGKPLPAGGYCPVQLIHQHPEQAVNPRWKMDKILRECWTPDSALLARMGIEPQWMKRWPSELSGGELQRFCIARVLGPGTRFLLCDEITSMLDVITQAQIWELVLDIVSERGLGLLVVTHNPDLAARVCDKIISLRSVIPSRLPQQPRQ